MTDAVSSLTAALADRYRIERELGAGGMATVYLAHDLKHDRQVAIKVLRPELAAALGAERFLAEVKITARLDHPHILTLIDSGSVADTLFYVMPFVRGESLRARITREGKLGLNEAIAITRQIAAALDYAHRHRVIHRDVKPENVLLHEGEAILTDFGIALAVSEAGGERLTGTGLSLGTPCYMSPEQAAGDRNVDARSDIYALGAVTYEMLAGEPPVTGASAQAVIAKLMTERPTSLRVLRDTVPPALDTAVMRALAKAPADRFATAGGFAAALQDAAETPAGRPGPVRGRRRLLGSAGAVALLALAAVLWIRRPSGGAMPDLASVAVLPFQDLGADHASGYLGDGIAETLISALARVTGLEVTGHTSSFALRNQADDVEEIGRRLGVATVLEGSVQRAGGQLRVTAQLIRTSNSRVLWSRSFDRNAADIFAVQDEVARAVVTALQGKVLAQADTALSAHGTRNPDAYDAYLLGRYYWGKRTTADMVKAAKYFQQAIAADSGYARAWSGLADTYVLFIPAEYNVPGIDADSVLDLAESAAHRAIALDPELGEAWSSLGEVLEYRDKWVEARQAFQKGVQLSPNYPTAHQWYAYDLCVWNRWDECLAEMSRARDLDPMSTVILVSLAAIYDGAERWSEADALHAQLATIDPDHPLVVGYRFWHDLLSGATDRWAGDYRHAASLGQVDTATGESIARQLADPTRRTAGLRELARTADPYTRLAVARLLGGDTAAIAWANALQGSPDRARVNAAGVTALLSPRLRADPRMQAALRRLGYPAS